jgi:hypothetical protein
MWLRRIVLRMNVVNAILAYIFLKTKNDLMRSLRCLCLSVCGSPINNFRTQLYIFMKFSREVIHWKWPRRHTFNPVVSTTPKGQTFKLLRWMQILTSVKVGPWRVKTGNHGNHTILVWQLNPYLWNNGLHSWTHCLTTVTIISTVTIEAKIHYFSVVKQCNWYTVVK